MNKLIMLELQLEIDSIIIGERIKGGTFRPCQTIIPSSTIEGALRRCLGIEVVAVGFLEEDTYELDEFVYSLRDRFLNNSVIPITTQYLRPKNTNGKIKAKVYIPLDNASKTNNLKGSIIQIGALKSKGFGRSKIVDVKEVESEIRQGILKVKVFEYETKSLGIEIISPIYGYLFKPDISSIGGVYMKALFPGSIVKAPKVLLESETFYDEE